MIPTSHFLGYTIEGREVEKNKIKENIQKELIKRCNEK